MFPPPSEVPPSDSPASSRSRRRSFTSATKSRAPAQMAQDVDLALGTGEHPGVAAGDPDDADPGQVREFPGRVRAHDPVEASPDREDGNAVRHDALDLAPQVHGHEHRPHRQRPAHGPEVAPGVGPQSPQRGRQPPSDEQVGRVQDGRHEKVRHPRHVGEHGGEQRHDDAAPVLPPRCRRAVAVHDAEDPVRMGVGELDGDGATHGMPEQHGPFRPDLVEQVPHDVGDLADGDALPWQRVAAREPGQARVEQTPAQRLREVAALAPVHPAAGEIPVQVHGPHRRAPGPSGPCAAALLDMA